MISQLVTTALTGVFALLSKYGKIPQGFDALIASVIMVLAQLAVVVVSNNPQLSDPLTLSLNVIIAVIGALGATTSTPKVLYTQAQSLRN